MTEITPLLHVFRLEATGKAKLLIKEKGVLAGIRVAREIFSVADKDLKIDILIKDGAEVNPGDIAFLISGQSAINP